MDPKLPEDRVRRAVDVVELECTVDSGEEGTVEPATTLRDQFWNLRANKRCVQLVQSELT